ncbi:LCP family protein [Caloramator sp. Dgby_cultured_2]|uniref:LCP family protein n=1 Tax=Caloramator sp. Dgby_cultured_2 TaxID=3029174 RepID=UPI003159335A
MWHRCKKFKVSFKIRFNYNPIHKYRNKKIKLISLMRDMFVEIPGKNKNRINAAYAFGGPELAIKTINHNFDLGISKYVTINFYGFEKVIDNIGGVEIDVKKMK